MILVTGGTGFVGRNLIKRLRDEGREVRCMDRSGNSAHIAALGAEIIRGDVLDSGSVAKAAEDCEAVIHLVGIWRASMSTYKAVHVQGTSNVVQAARQAGIKRFIHISAMGVSLEIPTGFYLTKGEAEPIVKDAGLDYTIFRPAVIIGKGDEFTTALVDMIKSAPMVPVLGSGLVKLQPLWVGDLVDCLAKSLDRPKTVNQTYDVAGPDALNYNEILDIIMQALGISKPKVHLPLSLVSPMIRFGEMFIPNLPITYDQLKIMSKDNVRDVTRTVRDFNLKQTGFRDAVSRYLP